VTDPTPRLLERLAVEFPDCALVPHEDEIFVYCESRAWAVPTNTPDIESEIAQARAWFVYR
jgi:hypothetical protein